MDTKVLLGIGLLGLLLYRQGGSGGGTRYFRLPSGVVVAEHELPQYGYVRYQGVWVPVGYLNNSQGTQYSAAYWQNLVQQGFDFAQQGIDIWQQIQDLFGPNWNDAILDPNQGLDYGQV
ncbi:hypothetical protein [Phaeodactylibacter xiamenensis]|uniref:hypothetical protein n=1 Tax=Phaeodactylibacter xiamenensis TaxID=1524460 RepID=UPI0024A9F4E1|nr:hypothetical protein [Phaeodactylibacter xiamenensis]